MPITNTQSTLLSLQNSTAKARYEQGQANLGSDKIDKNAFMNLLLTQLKLQDPMNPVDDKEFVAQQTQFAQLEKMDTLNASIEKTYQLGAASNLVGKRIDVKDEAGLITTGLVDSVELGKGTVGLNMNGKIFTSDQVVKIYNQ